MGKNRAGVITLAISFIISTGFIIFVIFIDPGPIDAARGQVATGISFKEYVARHADWEKYTQESALRGEESYKINCAFCHQTDKNNLLDQFKSGKLKHGGAELEVFSVISKGVPLEGMNRMDHLMENERWDVVHYLRSLNPSLPSSNKTDLETYFKEGI
jgi:mono/diheme cytochrome c family protein